MNHDTKLLYNDAVRAAYMDEIKGLFAACYDTFGSSPVSSIQTFEAGAAKAETMLLKLLK